MPTAATRRIQTAYEEARYDAAAQSVSEQIRSATFRYMVEDLGLPKGQAQIRADKEIAGTIGLSVCEELADMGISVAGMRVLDLGAGLGGLCAVLAAHGAFAVGVEPGAGWYKVAAERLRTFPGSSIVAGVGEAIPLASETVDLIVSLQVLEHVQNPLEVIKESFRVLKPGGYFYLAYENYFSFFEPHYRVPWLPLLPKSLGAAYLRMRGRNPQFLRESVTYTTFHGVRKMLAEVGFECMRRQKSADALKSGALTSLKWRLLKRLSGVSEQGTLNLITGFDHGKRLMQTAIYECLRKPAA